ncbi:MULTISPECIES: methyltransferase family protein [Stenotrophomonas]|jgi:protein-S-isoprenylcysteine O-methyltransferase Ste14|uniref:methyltransferase family protein n=1 Tax=Stenotrophomonas TaxID=40323 RepID=UPI000D1A80C7|nr:MULTISPECIES: isoprenylcysteine carboxylmethyltransferase family protein [Stenotrophomonas]ELC7366005.1 isoprenylcysteine carboxylmethyltransferase family protein [Stenotrophomonas maltophilia]ELF4107745.1 isoprenylcysteine carboxylmethyltransferase family protein [Stenotrophomonas maltophilia]MBA0250897.1 isoprenylcysteine carboxylmethyltransferase family protein [Stenotrophomonas maltophilia]MBA0319932.1 isoprenylcysteine carboxylmethyltransferase family protein [Stenotrophomonas maltophil
MRWLETRVPPPLVMLLCGAIGYLASRLAAGPVVPLPMPALLAGGVVAIGLTLNLLPKLAFRRVRTTVNPLRPAMASALVTHGVYRYTRNPMYLGQATVLAGVMLYLQSPVALLAVPLFVLYITRLQIMPEERALSARFPEAYAAFRQRVRRWL